jgi:hypothetical protein
MHAMKAFIDADKAKLQSFLTSAMDGYEVSASCLAALPRERAPHFQRLRGWMGPTAVEPVWTSRRRGKNVCPCRVLKRSSFSP